jgi:regulatory protein
MAWAFMAPRSHPDTGNVPREGPSLKARAMRLLARREHSREELRRKLVPRLQEGDDLEAVLDDLQVRGWLSDARFAEHSIRAKARRFGPIKLAHSLRAKGVDEAAIEAGFRAAGADGASNLQQVWAVRFRAAPTDEREKARQVRFLQGRGFALEDIFRFLKSLEGHP